MVLNFVENISNVNWKIFVKKIIVYLEIKWYRIKKKSNVSYLYALYNYFFKKNLLVKILQNLIKNVASKAKC